MADRARLDLFVEDAAQEAFGRSLVERVSGEENVACNISVRSARGGAPRALGELEAFQRGLRTGSLAVPMPDILVVLIDVNGVGWAERLRQVRRVVDEGAVARVAIGCPDPHVEAWYLADAISVKEVAGAHPKPVGSRGSREAFKECLADVVERGGAGSVAGGIDLAPEIVARMDLARAARNFPSLGRFVDSLRSALREFSRTGATERS
jgi:hypothetical protein